MASAGAQGPQGELKIQVLPPILAEMVWSVEPPVAPLAIPPSSIPSASPLRHCLSYPLHSILGTVSKFEVSYLPST